jgi:hypothetical protein
MTPKELIKLEAFDRGAFPPKARCEQAFRSMACTNADG